MAAATCPCVPHLHRPCTEINGLRLPQLLMIDEPLRHGHSSTLHFFSDHGGFSTTNGKRIWLLSCLTIATAFMERNNATDAVSTNRPDRVSASTASDSTHHVAGTSSTSSDFIRRRRDLLQLKSVNQRRSLAFVCQALGKPGACL